MNKLLEKIFSNPNFPYIIGGIIAFLVILFIVVLIVGKKDQKRLEETQVLNTIDDPNFVPNNTLDESFNIKPVEEEVVESYEQPIEPVVNSFEDIELPMNEEYEPESDEFYIASGAGPVKQEEIIPFDPDPEIEPYIPETSVQNFHKVADEIDRELDEIEKMGPILPKVAPVEIINDDNNIIEESVPTFASTSFSTVNVDSNILSDTAPAEVSNYSSNIIEEIDDEDNMDMPKFNN